MDTKLQMSIVKLLSGMIGKRMADDFDDDDDYESAIEDYPLSNENENKGEFQDPSKNPVKKDVKGFAKGGQVEAVGLELGSGKPKLTKMKGDADEVLNNILGKIKDAEPCDDDPLEAEFKALTKNRKVRK